MAKIFEKIGISKPRKSAFDLSHEKKMSADMGKLIPCLMEEIVPGDEFQVRTETMMRLAPMLAPIMHRVNVYVHYFFVPNRIVWNEWENFITGGQQGTSEPILPTLTYGNANFAKGRLPDYLGIPPGLTSSANVKVSSLPFRAYLKIWNDYYRDPNLVNEISVETATSTQLTEVRKRAWEKDYFTSALPWAQRGPEVEVPLNDPYADETLATRTDGGTGAFDGNVDTTTFSVDGNRMRSNSVQINIENLRDDLGIDINNLRTSSALQRWLEKSARGGYRYIETILSHFGVRSSDQRLQRPEYLGGGKQPIVISEVLNTTGTTEAPQGDMAGHGISTGVTNSFRKSFEEHGYVLGILSVLPRTGYQQGVHRTFIREDKTDYYWPEFANLGEQEIKNIELFLDTTNPDLMKETFGYQQRYAEYKYAQSTVHGDFRDNLDFWHMSRKFATQPSLGQAFVESDPTTRIFADETADPLWIQVYNSVKARRPMPFFSDPRLT